MCEHLREKLNLKNFPREDAFKDITCTICGTTLKISKALKLYGMLLIICCCVVWIIPIYVVWNVAYTPFLKTIWGIILDAIYKVAGTLVIQRIVGYHVYCKAFKRAIHDSEKHQEVL